MKKNLKSFLLIKKNKNNKLHYTLILSVVTIIVVMLSTFFIRYLTDYIGIDLSRNNRNQQKDTLQRILILIFFSPILEEFGFRGWLNLKEKFISFSIIALMWLFIIKEIIISPYYIIITLVTSIIIHIITMKFIVFYLKSFLNRYYLYCGYVSVFLFAYLHYNFNNFSEYLLSPIIVLPHICIGLLLSYYRNNYGLLSAVILHVILNLPTLILIIR